MIKIQPEEARALTQYIYSLCGVSLDETKSYLLENRLAPLLQEYSCATFSEFYMKARADMSRVISRKIVDAVTTGETSFFRDMAPFELLQNKLLPELIDRRRKTLGPGRPIPIRIWSAACSSGQEVYTTAMVLQDTLGNTSNYNIQLLGTDISDQAIARASYGVFSRMEVERGLPMEKLQRYFSAVDKGWKVRDEIRALASFRKLNLMDDFAGLGRFDIIFCRNVAIYFTEADKIKLFSKLGRSLEPDGALIIGSTESLTGLCPQFESMRYLRSVFYRLKT